MNPETKSLLPSSSDASINDVSDNIRRYELTDRFHAVYFIFCFLGMASLMPWNFFITASEYFQYKLRNTSVTGDTKFNDASVETSLQVDYESYISISSTLSNLLCIFLTAMFVRRISLKVRMVSSLLVITAVFAETAALVKVDTDSWQKQFFAVTMLSAAVINAATAVLTGSLFGFSCRFPNQYTQSVMLGQAVGGTFAALASIFSIAGGSSVNSSAFGYFMSATVVCILGLASFALLYCLPFSRFQLTKSEEGRQNHGEEMSFLNNDSGHRIVYITVIKQIWKNGIGVCLIFLVTLSCFPAICSAIKSVNYVKEDKWTDTYFTPVVCFLFFNLADMAGRYIAGKIQHPSFRHSNLLLCLSVMRVVFIPLFMLCNALPRPHSLPVVFKHDAFPIVFILLLGLSNGHLSTLNMMYAPLHVSLGHAEVTGALMAFSVVLGLACGSGLSLLFIQLL